MPGKPTPIRPEMAERLADEMGGMDRPVLAEDTGVNYGLIGHILSGKRPMTRDAAKKFAYYFDVRPEYLMGEDNYRTEGDYLRHIQELTTKGAYIPTISESLAFDVLCSYFGIREEVQTVEIKAGKPINVFKVVYDGREYYISADQKEALRKMIRENIKSQVLFYYNAVQPGNESIKKQFIKAAESQVIDDRPAEEILAEVEKTRRRPNTVNIDS